MSEQILTRRVIQICVAHGYAIHNHKGQFSSVGGIIALCEDGTLWRKPDGDNTWYQFDGPPEPRSAQDVRSEGLLDIDFGKRERRAVVEGLPLAELEE